MRILIVEDDAALRKVLNKRIKEEGYAVDSYGDGIAALEYARAAEYDAMVLDVMLPGMDGFALLRSLRADGFGGGVLMLTARDTVEDRVAGLDLGADDYLTKPFAFQELSARLRALLRKSVQGRSPVLAVGELQMDTVRHSVNCGERQISLTAKEYALLEYLMRNAGQVLTRDQIYSHVWDYGSSFETNLVDAYIGYLRNKIDRGRDVKYLHTVRGFGYVLREEDERCAQ